MPIHKPRTSKKALAKSTARLEEKLDGLFSLLKSGAQPQALLGAAAQSTNETSTVEHARYPTPTPSDVQARQLSEHGLAYSAVAPGHGQNKTVYVFCLSIPLLLILLLSLHALFCFSSFLFVSPKALTRYCSTENFTANIKIGYLIVASCPGPTTGPDTNG
jgi:hypothetical protein